MNVQTCERTSLLCTISNLVSTAPYFRYCKNANHVVISSAFESTLCLFIFSRSHPYKSGALKELLRAQEISLLRDINEAIEKRVENRISTARRFAVILLFLIGGIHK